MRLFSLSLLSVGIVCVGCGQSQNAEVVTLTPSPASFVIQGTVLAAADVSTITRGDKNLGILASDEGAVIQILSFDPNGREAEVRINHTLAASADTEIDFEASAFLDGWYYVTGSHGVAKKKGTYQESRYRIFRFRLGDDAILSNLQTATLDTLFANDPVLANYHRMPLQEKGVNIEGLAAKDNALFVGLRSPNLNGDAFVIRVDADALFTGEDFSYDLLSLPLGAGLGIRGMTVFRDGFLLIAGNAGSEESKEFPVTVDYIEGRPSELVFWDPSSDEVVRLGILPRRGKGKEEAILAISEGGADSDAEVLILYDSIQNGGGTIFKIPPFPSSL